MESSSRRQSRVLLPVAILGALAASAVLYRSAGARTRTTTLAPAISEVADLPGLDPRGGAREPALAAAAPFASLPCPEGMVLVDGDYCQVVGHVCRRRLDGPVERCAEYAAPPICEGEIQRKRFCIDRFEYPNLAGVRPVVMVSWLEARAACEVEGKRLCTAGEWTLACEGEQRLPYPYGYVRDDTACNIDRKGTVPDVEAFGNPKAIPDEVARLDRRVASGQMPRCTSPYGVQDMTGNVDEWVVNEKHFAAPSKTGEQRPFVSALKGGYWGPVRNRCRATTTFHNEWFRYYGVGFRCCASAASPP
jgi:sulfatase modifying factor 1